MAAYSKYGHTTGGLNRIFLMRSLFRSMSRFWAASALCVLAGADAPARGDSGMDAALVRGRLMFAQGDTFSAITEYKRILFFCRDTGLSGRMCVEVADSLAAKGAFSSAAEWFEKAAAFSPDSQKNELYLAAVVALIRCRGYRDASYQLQNIDTARAGPRLKRQYLLCSGTLSLYDYDWDRAVRSFRAYLAPCPASLGRFEAWLAQNRPPREKSRAAARILSALVPGAGQAYAGEWGGALNGLIINGVTGYPAFSALISREWIDASLYIWLFSRFYIGGMDVAADKADAADERAGRRYARQFMNDFAGLATGCGNCDEEKGER